MCWNNRNYYTCLFMGHQTITIRILLSYITLIINLIMWHSFSKLFSQNILFMGAMRTCVFSFFSVIVPAIYQTHTLQNQIKLKIKYCQRHHQYHQHTYAQCAHTATGKIVTKEFLHGFFNWIKCSDNFETKNRNTR